MSSNRDMPWSPSTASEMSRRNSITSLSSRTGLGKETVSQALDDIHASASRSSALTAFNDFAPPPVNPEVQDEKPPNGTLGTFYSRFRSSVGSARPRPSSASSSRDVSVQPHPTVPSTSRPSSKRSSRPISGHSGGHPGPSLVDMQAQPSSRHERLPSSSEKLIEPAPLPGLGEEPGPDARRASSSSINLTSDQPRRESFQLSGNEKRSNKAQISTFQPRQALAAPKVTNSPLLSPHLGYGKGRDAFNPSDVASAKSLPFASVTSLNVPASSVYEAFDTPIENEATSSRSTNYSPALSRSDSVTPALAPANHVMHEMKRKVLSRDFWMKDENAKVCFSCGDAFTTFRRKHHCRTCGQIYDAKCTVLIPGKLFDQPGRLRICRTCENIIIGDESSDDVSEGDDQASALHTKSIRFSALPWTPANDRYDGSDQVDPASSRNLYEPRRRPTGATAQDYPAQTLTRPSSSRSLRSMSSRPRSSSHKIRRPRHNHIRSLGTTTEDGVPFQKLVADYSSRDPLLPAFHTDAIVDPDIAPFMSGDDSSDDDLQSVGSVLHGDFGDQVSHHHNLSGSFKKSRPRPMSSRSQFDLSMNDADDVASLASSRPRRKRMHRTQSTGSISVRPGNSHRASRGELHPVETPPITPYSDANLENVFPDLGDNPNGQRKPPSLAELDNASMRHVKKLLKQLLHDGGIANSKLWKKILLSILLRCAEDVDPNIQRGDDIDIRNYVKLKKAPGRTPCDSSYISGVVFSKNVALKGMPRSVSDARILILSFPIVYARHKNHFMSLDPVIAQESEYLKNLVRRIVALKPNVVLVQSQVAGLALDFLRHSGLVVACNVKESVLQAVARCTQTTIINSVDKLTMDPSELGHCAKFEFKTFIFDNLKKTYAYVSGCAKDLGCTIVLRGSDVEELRRVKRVTEFMAYVVYNLKLETSLIRDQFLTLSEESEDFSSSVTMGQLQLHLAHSSAKVDSPHDQDDAKPSPELEKGESLEYDRLVHDMTTRTLSVSPAVRFPAPYLLLKAQEQERQMRAMKGNIEMAEKASAPDIEDEQPSFELLQPKMIFEVQQNTSEQLRESLKGIRKAEYERAANHFTALKRRWESYISGARDPFSPLSHQQIVVLYSIISTPSSNACEGPDLLGINFYQDYDVDGDLEPDVPLGEYIERLCDQAKLPCTSSNCDQTMMKHHRQYVHGEGQVSVHVNNHASKLRGLENTILMWSACRECHQETPVIPMSRNSWKFSFAKYLELTFWSRKLRPRTGICPHDVQRSHIRYFGFNSLAVSIQYDPIRIMEVSVPRNAISWKVEKDVELKNRIYQRIESRMKRFLTSVRERINSINLKAIPTEHLKEVRTQIESFQRRVSEDEQFVIGKLQEKYLNSTYYEIIPLNRALRAMQERVSVWVGLFADFERKYFPSDRDVRKLAQQRLRDFYFEKEQLDSGDEAIPHYPAQDEKQVLSTGWARTSDSDLQDAQMLSITIAEQESTLPASQTISGNQPPVVQNLDLAVDSIAASSASPILQSKLASEARGAATPDNPSRSGSASPTKARAASPLSNRSQALLSEPKDQGRVHGVPAAVRRSNNSSNNVTTSSPPLLRSHTQPPPQLASEAAHAPDQNTAKLGLPSLIPVPAKIAARSEKSAEKSTEKPETRNLGFSKVTSTPAATTKKSTLQSMIPRSITSSSRVSALTRQFEQITREFERQKQRERRQRLARVRQTKVYSVGSYQPVMEVYRNANDAVQEQEPTFASSRGGPRGAAAEQPNGQLDVSDELGENDTTEGAQGAAALVAGDVPVAEDEPLESSQEQLLSEESTLREQSYPTSDVEHAPSDTEQTLNGEIDDVTGEKSQIDVGRPSETVDIPKHDKTSILKILSNLWSERSASGWADLDYPLAATEHIYSDSDVIPREDEPSSVIAFALASDYYKSQLQSFRDRVKADPTVLVNPPSGETEIEQTLLGRTATHVSYTFPAGMARMRCKVFFAESFDAIQQKCGVSDRIVESLSRCIKFDSKGGKTKSIFLKTMDERFVLKSLSTVETQSFLQFAPDYFDYMSKCLFHNLPSALAKMLGLYEVTIKNPETGIDFTCFLQMMENVFYEGPSNQTFDLKGSMRNRKIQTTGEKDEVLLDENLLDYLASAPIYIRNHANSQMASSISNDTLFCSKQNVMDYSLIVGLYDDRQELMVGIIDYIRTYTWDKKLESWIKDRGKKKPTVRSPKEYRNRFRASISRYFPLAPSCWQIFGIQRTEQPPNAWWESLGRRSDSRDDLDLIEEDEGMGDEVVPTS